MGGTAYVRWAEASYGGPAVLRDPTGGRDMGARKERAAVYRGAVVAAPLVYGSSDPIRAYARMRRGARAPAHPHPTQAA